MTAVLRYGTTACSPCGNAATTAGDWLSCATPYRALHTPSHVSVRMPAWRRVSPIEQAASPMNRKTNPATMSASWPRSSDATSSVRQGLLGHYTGAPPPKVYRAGPPRTRLNWSPAASVSAPWRLLMRPTVWGLTVDG